ncbi:MAG: hypothetical protein WD894_27015, partial [Pirellulales bacterium]
MLPDYSKEEWCILWDRAKEIEKSLPELRRKAYARLTSKVPQLATKYRTFDGLCRGYAAGKLPPDIVSVAGPECDRVIRLAAEAVEARRRSEILLAEKRAADTRKLLDPNVDEIPLGPYPKLRNCRTFPWVHSRFAVVVLSGFQGSC